MHYYYVIYGENYYRRAGSPVAYNDTIHRSEKQSKKPENFTARAGSQTSNSIFLLFLFEFDFLKALT